MIAFVPQQIHLMKTYDPDCKIMYCSTPERSLFWDCVVNCNHLIELTIILKWLSVDRLFRCIFRLEVATLVQRSVNRPLQTGLGTPCITTHLIRGQNDQLKTKQKKEIDVLGYWEIDALGYYQTAFVPHSSLFCINLFHEANSSVMHLPNGSPD